MRIVETYSHQGGEEILIVHQPELWQEVQNVIESIDAEACRTKVSRERNRIGEMLYSPEDMNKAFAAGFHRNGWNQERNSFFVTSDRNLMRRIWHLPASEQKREIENSGQIPISTYNQTDFVKNRVGVEVQFGKYSFVAHDIFVKHMSFFVSDAIDVGIEILPMKELETQMSSGVPYYERDLLNIIRQGRGVPAVPLVLMGIAP